MKEGKEGGYGVYGWYVAVVVAELNRNIHTGRPTQTMGRVPVGRLRLFEVRTHRHGPLTDS